MDFVQVHGNNVKQYLDAYDVVAASVRPSRIKTKQLAILELHFVLAPFGGIFILNGPLGDIKGLVSFLVKKGNLDAIHKNLENVGYCDRFYLCDFTPGSVSTEHSLQSKNPLVWKGIPFSIHLLVEQSRQVYDDHSSHNREFLVRTSDGEIKQVKGYRGDGSLTGRRALPVEDARIMVNLARLPETATLLDPFAGCGGILYEARAIRPSAFLISADIDPVLEPGLSMFANRHFTTDSCNLELDGVLIDALVTEVPFAAEVTDTVVRALVHLTRCLNENGQMVLMCTAEQMIPIREALAGTNLSALYERNVNRQGTGVIIAAWCRCPMEAARIRSLNDAISNIY